MGTVGGALSQEFVETNAKICHSRPVEEQPETEQEKKRPKKGYAIRDPDSTTHTGTIETAVELVPLRSNWLQT